MTASSGWASLLGVKRTIAVGTTVVKYTFTEANFLSKLFKLLSWEDRGAFLLEDYKAKKSASLKKGGAGDVDVDAKFVFLCKAPGKFEDIPLWQHVCLGIVGAANVRVEESGEKLSDWQSADLYVMDFQFLRMKELWENGEVPEPDKPNTDGPFSPATNLHDHWRKYHGRRLRDVEAQDSKEGKGKGIEAEGFKNGKLPVQSSGDDDGRNLLMNVTVNGFEKYFAQDRGQKLDTHKVFVPRDVEWGEQFGDDGMHLEAFEDDISDGHLTRTCYRDRMMTLGEWKHIVFGEDRGRRKKRLERGGSIRTPGRTPASREPQRRKKRSATGQFPSEPAIKRLKELKLEDVPLDMDAQTSGDESGTHQTGDTSESEGAEAVAAQLEALNEEWENITLETLARLLRFPENPDAIKNVEEMKRFLNARGLGTDCLEA